MSAVLDQADDHLRPMALSDLPAVLTVEARAYRYPWTREVFADCLRVGYACWVYENGGTVGAYGIMTVSGGECHVLNLCVDPDLQGQGVGRGLLRRLLEVARQANADTAFLEARPSNEAALRLYRSEGFNEVGRRKRYYPAPKRREDALIFAKTL